MNKKISMCMHKNPITLDEDTPIAQALEIFEEHCISHILVTSNGKLTGVVSKQDLLANAVDLLKHSSGSVFNSLELKTRSIADIMGVNVITVRPNDVVDYGVELLLQNQFHCLPVVDKHQRPVGIVTAFDLLKGYYQEFESGTVSIW